MRQIPRTPAIGGGRAGRFVAGKVERIDRQGRSVWLHAT